MLDMKEKDQESSFCFNCSTSIDYVNKSISSNINFAPCKIFE